jgi:hypothetical protein
MQNGPFQVMVVIAIAMSSSAEAEGWKLGGQKLYPWDIMKRPEISSAWQSAVAKAKVPKQEQFWVQDMTGPSSAVIATVAGGRELLVGQPRLSNLAIKSIMPDNHRSATFNRLRGMSAGAARGSVLDLDLGKQKAAAGQPEGAEALEAVAGVIGQRTQPATNVGNRSTLSVEGLVCPGSVIDAPKIGQWDQLHFKPQPQSESKLPTNYQGTSGGGIWRIYLQTGSDGRYTPAETRLTGVAYWQDQVAGSLGIIGHGPISVYGHLLAEIYRRWPP